MEEIRRCSICGAILEPDDLGNNPYPIGSEEKNGVCCSICDHFFVLPARRAYMEPEEAEAWAAEKIKAGELPTMRDVDTMLERKEYYLNKVYANGRGDRAEKIASKMESPNLDEITKKLEWDDEGFIFEEMDYPHRVARRYAERLDELETERREQKRLS